MKFIFNNREFEISDFSVCGSIDDIQIDDMLIYDEHGFEVTQDSIIEAGVDYLLENHMETIENRLFDSYIMKAEYSYEGDR